MGLQVEDEKKATENGGNQVHLSSQNEQQIRKMRYSASDIVLLNGNDKEERENESESDSSSSSSSSDETSDEEQNRDIVDFSDARISFSRTFDRGKIEEHFLPCVPIRIRINKQEVVYGAYQHRLYPTLYTIEIVHGRFKWKVLKRYNHFTQVRNHLEVHRAALIVKHPTMATRLEKVPKLPRRPEISIRSKKKKNKRMRKLQKFLQKVVNIDRYRNNEHVLDFLEVSHLSFIHDLGTKHKELGVLKRAGGHTFSKSLLKNHLVWIWHKRWLVLRNTFIVYIDKETNTIRDVLLFDNKFNVSCDKTKTGIKNGIMISNNRRNLVVRFHSIAEVRSYFKSIVNVMGKEGRDWIREHRYDSFAPIRTNTHIKWFIDGEGYFAAVADAIKKAKEEIFITDWWLSPELVLKRPITDIRKWRLDTLLKEKADQGVKIFIILYKELEVTLPINSAYTKRYLTSLHPENIKVMRHPDHQPTSENAVWYWAHHEKLVCIDQKVTFMGGLDLCYGRWDNQTHRLVDFGSATPNFMAKTDSALINVSKLFVETDFIESEYHKQQLRKLPQSANKWFIGKDYCNFYIKDVEDVENPHSDHIDRNNYPRMPWHDIACGMYGNAARDVGRHFIERWNFTKHLKCKDLVDIPYLLPRCEPITDDGYNDFHISTKANVQVLRSSSHWSAGLLSTEHSILDAYKDTIRNSKYFIYIEVNFNKETFRVFIVMPLLPSFPGEIGTSAATSLCFVEFWNLQSTQNIINSLLENGVEDPTEYITFNSLRNYADLRKKMVTEILYVHSKLMIVDDEVAIIGSANINDRSMLGDRDSELAVCVRDENKTLPGVMNGVECRVGGFASTLRRKLFQEHLGLMNEPYYSVVDPVCNHFYRNVWCKQAKRNSEIFEQVFGCLPTNEVKSFGELDEYKKKQFLQTTDPGEARNLLKEIKGFIVEKPLEFLKNQNLYPPADSKEYVVPIKIFT